MRGRNKQRKEDEIAQLGCQTLYSLGAAQNSTWAIATQQQEPCQTPRVCTRARAPSQQGCWLGAPHLRHLPWSNRARKAASPEPQLREEAVLHSIRPEPLMPQTPVKPVRGASYTCPTTYDTTHAPVTPAGREDCHTRRYYNGLYSTDGVVPASLGKSTEGIPPSCVRLPTTDGSQVVPEDCHPQVSLGSNTPLPSWHNTWQPTPLQPSFDISLLVHTGQLAHRSVPLVPGAGGNAGALAVGVPAGTKQYGFVGCLLRVTC